MKDKYEITTFNHINFLIAYELYDSLNRKNEDIKVSELIKRVKNKVGIDNMDFYEFINSGNVFSLLYTSLVVPKEMFENEEKGKKFFNNFNEDFNDYFSEIEGGYNSSFTFLRKLRNSVSHVHFEWDESRSNLTMYNINNKGKKNFKVKISLQNLANFCLKLSKYVTNNTP